MGVRGLALTAWMSGALAVLYGAFSLSESLHLRGWTLVGAYFAALGAGLVFAAYQAAHAAGKRLRLSRDWLTWRCLAWAAAGALAVAYHADNGWTVAAVAIGAVVFYARRPWLLWSLIARLFEGVGNVERAIAVRRQALTLRPDPEAAVGLWHAIARSNLSLKRGQAALESLDAAKSLPAYPEPTTFTALDMDACQVAALIELDRFEEALQVCERLLRAPEGDVLGPWRLLLTHSLLADMALYRAWLDEAVAQANCILHAVPPAAAAGPLRSLVAAAHRVRAAAHVVTKQYDEARAECLRALRWSRDPTTETSVASIRAQTCLGTGDAEGAERESAIALRSLPGNLEARYWRGRALRESGHKDRGETLLRALATDFPVEHWGVQARIAVA